MSLMNKKMLSGLFALTLALIAVPVWASPYCHLHRYVEIPFKSGETQLNSEAIKILLDRVILVPGLEVNVVLLSAVRPRNKQKDDPVCKGDKKRLDNIKLFLADRGISKNKIYSEPRYDRVIEDEVDYSIFIEVFGQFDSCYCSIQNDDPKSQGKKTVCDFG